MKFWEPVSKALFTGLKPVKKPGSGVGLTGSTICAGGQNTNIAHTKFTGFFPQSACVSQVYSKFFYKFTSNSES